MRATDLAMLHHLSLAVSELEPAGAVYDAALTALGYRRVCEGSDFIGYGIEADKDKFALKLSSDPVSSNSRQHIAFAAPTREAVDRFHAAALAAGAMDDGTPGTRPNYGPNYYAAFIIDPDGHRIEAVINR